MGTREFESEDEARKRKRRIADKLAEIEKSKKDITEDPEPDDSLQDDLDDEEAEEDAELDSEIATELEEDDEDEDDLATEVEEEDDDDLGIIDEQVIAKIDSYVSPHELTSAATIAGALIFSLSSTAVAALNASGGEKWRAEEIYKELNQKMSSNSVAKEAVEFVNALKKELQKS